MAAKSRTRLPGIDTLLAVGQAFSVDLPTEEAMRRVAREVARALGADMVGAYFLDASKEALVPVAGYRVPKELLPTLLGTPFPLDRFPVLREAWRTREPIWTLDYRGDPRFDQKFLTDFRPQALLFAPTPVRGEIVGGLFLAWWEARPAFTPDELRLIRGIASQVGLALENGELARRTERERAEQRQLLETTLEHTSQGISVIDQDLRLLAWNTRLLDLLAFPREFARVGKPLADFLHYNAERGEYGPGDPDQQVAERVALARRFLPHVFERTRQDGTVIEVRGNPMPGGGFVTTYTDVTARRQTEEALRRRVVEATSLLEVARAITASLDLQAVLELIVERACSLVGTERSALAIVEPASPDAVIRFVARRGMTPGFPDEMRPRHWRDGTTPMAISERRPVWSADLLADPAFDLSPQVRAAVLAEGYRGVLSVPLLAADRVLGALAVYRDAPGPFGQDQIGLLQALAAQGAIAIENARLFEEAERRRREAEVVADLSRHISASLDLDTTLQRVAEGARELCQSDIARVAHRDPASGVVAFRYSTGVRDPAMVSFSVQPGRGIGGLVLATGRPFRTDNYAEDPRISKEYLPVVQDEGIVTTMAVPIRIDGRVEGLLHVDNRTSRVFTDRDEAVLLRLAEHAAIAIRNARLFGETERRRRSAESLAGVGRVLAQSLDPEEVGQRVVDTIRALLGALNAALYLADPDSGDLTTLAFSGDMGPGFSRETVLPRGTTAAGLAVRDHRSVVTPDLLADPRITLGPEARARIERSPYRAALSVPLAIQDRVIGALSVGEPAHRVFDREEIALTQTFADQAALALENARLYAEVTRARDFLRSITESSPDGIVTTDVHGRLTYVSPGAEELFGYRAEEVLGRSAVEFFAGGPREARTVMERLSAEGQIRSLESAVVAKGGRLVAVNSSASLLRDADGRIIGTLGVFKDLTERKRAEDALRDSEERFRSAFEHSGIGMALQSLDGRYLRVNRALCDMLGYSEAELLATTWQALTLPDDVEPGQRARLTDGDIRAYQVEKRYLHKDGHPVWTLASISLVRDRGGQPLYFIAQVQDISERKRAEEAREALEAQLRQAQKMEAVGRLAGGVAHDFNNLLTVIRGRSDLLLYRLGPDDPLRRHVLLLQQTAERAAALTQQLLAFSRKQMLQPRILDLNGVVESTTTMLRRLIGEDIELDIRLDPDLGRVKADPGQLEQVILNLAVNARDAMPQGGRLSIETANVELDEAFARRNPGARPGGFARLQIGDTGVGMDATVQAHLFEPFFTTKALGQGTGLGLATVYGIVKQSGGYIKVDSAPGRGTTFAIYLPHVEEPGELREATASRAGSMAGSETILLVEDEDAVRELGREVLEMRGYTVLEAPHGAQALLVAERHAGPIHLMVTDVVMPHMSGRELVERLAPRRPDMRILYVSGYTDDAIVREGMLQPGTSFLQKPFTPDTLARRVRELLDAPQPP